MTVLEEHKARAVANSLPRIAKALDDISKSLALLLLDKEELSPEHERHAAKVLEEIEE